MGRKKIAKKAEELSVAIAVSSCAGTEHLEQQQTPRKRGRPRKIVEKVETEEIKQEAEVRESDLKKTKEEEEEEEKRGAKELEVGDAEKEGELPKEVRRSSRARRKSKPQKSS